MARIDAAVADAAAEMTTEDMNPPVHVGTDMSLAQQRRLARKLITGVDSRDS